MAENQIDKTFGNDNEDTGNSCARHCNYYGVNGNFHAIQNFWKYLKYTAYRMLNRRDQKGKFRYEKYLRAWNYYISEPHLTTDIWNWNPMTA